MKRVTEYIIPETGFSVVSEEKYKRIMREEKPSVEKVYNQLKKIEDILGDEYDLDRLRDLVQADKEGRCMVLPIAIGTTVYHITTCRDFQKVLDGTLYDSNGGYGTATGYYCPCELDENCPFDTEDFDCDENKNKRNIFEDIVEEVHTGDTEDYICLGYSGTVFFDEIGKTVFLTRAEAEDALRRAQKCER